MSPCNRNIAATVACLLLLQCGAMAYVTGGTVTWSSVVSATTTQPPAIRMMGVTMVSGRTVIIVQLSSHVAAVDALTGTTKWLVEPVVRSGTTATFIEAITVSGNIVINAFIGMKAMHGSRNVLITGNQFTRNSLWAIGLMPGAAANAENFDGGSIISNNLNLTIKRLTTITIILMVPTLVASFMGMNVVLPLSDSSHYSFFVILVISLAFSLVLSWYFQRKNLF